MNSLNFYGKRKQQNVESDSDLSENHSDISNSDDSEDNYVPDDDILQLILTHRISVQILEIFKMKMMEFKMMALINPKEKNDEWNRINHVHKLHTTGKIMPLLEAHFLLLAILDCKKGLCMMTRVKRHCQLKYPINFLTIAL